MAMKRLRINNNEDIQEVVAYELHRGYNRLNDTQAVKHWYDVDVCKVSNDTVSVEAYSEDEAAELALEEAFSHNWDYDDIEIENIRDTGEAC